MHGAYRRNVPRADPPWNSAETRESWPAGLSIVLRQAIEPHALSHHTVAFKAALSWEGDCPFHAATTPDVLPKRPLGSSATRPSHGGAWRHNIVRRQSRCGLFLQCRARRGGRGARTHLGGRSGLLPLSGPDHRHPRRAQRKIGNATRCVRRLECPRLEPSGGLSKHRHGRHNRRTVTRTRRARCHVRGLRSERDLLSANT